MPDYMQLYAKALEGLSTGGKKLEASLQEIEEGKKAAIAGGQQALISGGLGGTTVTGAVPLAAEKTAARKRLAARGEAEETYLTTLASFAAFAQRAEEAQAQRAFETEQSYLQRQSAEAMQIRGMQTPSQPGLDVFGQPMAGSLAETEQAYMRTQMAGGGKSYAEQFPSIYGTTGGVKTPDWTGGTTITGDRTTGTTPTWQTSWGQETPTEELMAGTQYQWAAPPTQQQIGMTGAMGSLPGLTTPQSAQTKPQVDTTNWTEAEKKAWANYIPGVSGYNVLALKQRQGLK